MIDKKGTVDTLSTIESGSLRTSQKLIGLYDYVAVSRSHWSNRDIYTLFAVYLRPSLNVKLEFIQGLDHRSDRRAACRQARFPPTKPPSDGSSEKECFHSPIQTKF